MQRHETIKRKVKPILVLIAIPILLSMIFSLCFSEVYVEEIPIAVCDLDGSQSSADFVERLASGGGLSAALHTRNLAEMKEAMMMGAVQAAIVFPDGFGSGISAGRGAEAMFLVNGTNFMISNNALLYASNIFNAANADIRVCSMETGGIVPTAAERIGGTLSFNDRMLYNPKISYLWFIILGLLAILVQQTYLAMLSSLLVYSKERSMMLPEIWQRSGAFYANLTKTSAIYACCSIIGVISSLLAINRWFEIPLNGGFPGVLALTAVFLLDMTAVSLVIASFFRDEAHCVQFDMFLAIPTMLACSYAWPEYMMPPLFAPVMKAVWPLYYYAIPLRDLILKGAGLEMLGSYLAGGCLFAAFWLPAGAWLYHRSLGAGRESFRENTERTPYISIGKDVD